MNVGSQAPDAMERKLCAHEDPSAFPHCALVPQKETNDE